MTAVMSEIINTNHGYIWNEKETKGALLNKQNYHAIILSGGGIDSFMSTIAYVEQRTKGCFPFNEIYANTYGVRNDQAVPTITFKLTFLLVDYSQQSYEAERHMTLAQSEWFKSKSNAYWNFEAEVITINDDLMHLLRNPLANRHKAKEDAAKAGVAYSAGDDYVPNRNARFLFNAAGLAETNGADTIILGAVGNVNQDNSWAFIKAAHETIKQSNRDNFPSIYAPFVLLTKSMVALYADEKDVTLDLNGITTSCFDSKEILPLDDTKSIIVQCGKCRSCSSLKQAFKFADVVDPYIYAEELNAVELPPNGYTVASGKSGGFSDDS